MPGAIGYDELLEFISHKIQIRVPLNEVLKAFRLFVDDATREFSFEDLKRVAEVLGVRMTDEVLQPILSNKRKKGKKKPNKVSFSH